MEKAVEVLQSVEAPVAGAKRERICVACHPNQAALAREVADDLLPLIPCEVYLSGQVHTAPDEAEVRLFLREMSLVVFIVTRDFLFQENNAHDVLFRLAEAGHVRMLMIQAEQGIEADFNAVCGAYHLLDRASGRYREALSEFVEDRLDAHLLVGLSEDQEHINQGIFEHRCFISYRKKDRTLLLQLVDGIRRYPGFLDVSLWYDDALVAGENYNDQIAAKLDAADCVLFAVTSSFLEEGNYVLEREYPQAVRAAKPMVPVLMEPVDEALLHELYPDLGECVAWGDDEKLAQALSAAFGGRDPQRDPSPAQKHFLAREFTGGWRTERNADLAYKLYHEAAEAGYPWSMARLADDYHTGALFKLDEDKARYWLEQSVESLNSLMNSTAPQAPEAISIGQTLAKLAEEAFTSRFAQKDMDGAFQMACQFADAAEYLRRAGVTSPRFCGGRADLLKARCCMARAEYEEALRYLNRSEETLVGLEAFGSIYAVANVAELLAQRGEAFLRLHREKDRLDWIRNDLAGALDRCLYINEVSHDNYALTLQVLSNLMYVATQYERTRRSAKEASALAQMVLDGCIRLIQIARPGELALAGSPFNIDFLYARALYYAATLGRIAPDSEKLEECQRAIAELQSRGSTQAVDDLATQAADASTIHGIRLRLDWWTTWALMAYAEPQLASMFVPTQFWESDGPSQIDNYTVSAYCCPECGSRLYKTVFPPANDPMLYVSPDSDAYISPARVFACVRGHFFAAPKGRKLVQGPVYQACAMVDDYPVDLPQWWWRYFNALGDARARRDE